MRRWFLLLPSLLLGQTRIDEATQIRINPSRGLSKPSVEVFQFTGLTNSISVLGQTTNSSAVLVYRNGLLLAQGSSLDYTRNGQVITLLGSSVSNTGDIVQVVYWI